MVLGAWGGGRIYWRMESRTWSHSDGAPNSKRRRRQIRILLPTHANFDEQHMCCKREQVGSTTWWTVYARFCRWKTCKVFIKSTSHWSCICRTDTLFIFVLSAFRRKMGKMNMSWFWRSHRRKWKKLRASISGRPDSWFCQTPKLHSRDFFFQVEWGALKVLNVSAKTEEETFDAPDEEADDSAAVHQLTRQEMEHENLMKQWKQQHSLRRSADPKTAGKGQLWSLCLPIFDLLFRYYHHPYRYF